MPRPAPVRRAVRTANGPRTTPSAPPTTTGEVGSATVLGAQNRTHAVVIAYESGLVAPGFQAPPGF
ncbi:hypothetical protein GCM10010195_44500 [Kitasatospora griseola]|nr:hypothetical protein GCM10010195_44500 [Kitasatospora griseola]